MNPTFPALALAAAILDVTLSYPEHLEGAVGSPARWLRAWARTLEAAAPRMEGRLILVAYMAPPFALAAALDRLLPEGPLGFAARALLARVGKLCESRRFTWPGRGGPATSFLA